MSKKRNIPFGYMMQDGKITTHPHEVLAVVTIFSDYLAGLSLNQIAAKMKVPYSEGVLWNKNMVKRILENPKYTGMEGYPQLISEETFQAVAEKKATKATSLCILPEGLQTIRNLACCRKCGKKLFRKSQKWNCHNGDCSKFQFELTDQMLTSAVLNVLNTVIANSALVETDGTSTVYTPTSDIIRQQNEINHMMDSPQIDYERIQTEIYKLAAMKYDCCQCSDAPLKTELLKSLLNDRKQMDSLDTNLLESCVTQIYVSHCCTIEMTFINGVIIQNITERTEGT